MFIKYRYIEIHSFSLCSFKYRFGMLLLVVPVNTSRNDTSFRLGVRVHNEQPPSLAPSTNTVPAYMMKKILDRLWYGYIYYVRTTTYFGGILLTISRYIAASIVISIIVRSFRSASLGTCNACGGGGGFEVSPVVPVVAAPAVVVVMGDDRGSHRSNAS